MNNNIVTTNTNGITTASASAMYEAVRNNPFLKNVMGKSDSTITRHIHELCSFGKFVTASKDWMITDFDISNIDSDEIRNGVRVRSMQQASHWHDITAKDIEDYKHYLTFVKGMRTTTITQAIYIIKSYARVAFDAGALSIQELTHIDNIRGYRGNEAEHLDSHRQKNAVRDRHNLKGNVTHLSKKQINALKYNQPETLAGKRDALLFCILLDHGLRISDAINLTADCINMETGMMTVKTKKTGVTLNLQMTDDVINAFAEYISLYQPAEPTASIWTGVSKHGTASGTWGKHSAQMEVTKVGEMFGIQNLSAHDCRHCWTDRAIEGGSDLVAVQQAGGWKNLNMVSHYAQKKAVSNSGVKLS